VIRPARPRDAEAIAEIWNHAIRETTITFTTAQKSLAEITDQIAKQPFLVCELDAQIVGFVTCSQFRNGPGYAHSAEHSIHLRTKAKGQGHGSALMAAIEQTAFAQGVHVMVAGISGENIAGQRFHAAIGYEPTGRMREVGHKFGRWHDLVLMQKFL